jgi:hypothetical protein
VASCSDGRDGMHKRPVAQPRGADCPAAGSLLAARAHQARPLMARPADRLTRDTPFPLFTAQEAKPKSKPAAEEPPPPAAKPKPAAEEPPPPAAKPPAPKKKAPAEEAPPEKTKSKPPPPPPAGAGRGR